MSNAHTSENKMKLVAALFAFASLYSPVQAGTWSKTVKTKGDCSAGVVNEVRCLRSQWGRPDPEDQGGLEALMALPGPFSPRFSYRD